MKVSIVIPCYNEKDTIERIVEAVRSAPIGSKEIIVVDNSSHDGTKTSWRRGFLKWLTRSFIIQPEIIAKLARSGCSIYEVGISYSGRTYREGKKIGWRDGFRAIYAILKYNLLRRTATAEIADTN